MNRLQNYYFIFYFIFSNISIILVGIYTRAREVHILKIYYITNHYTHSTAMMRIYYNIYSTKPLSVCNFDVFFLQTTSSEDYVLFAI